MLAFVESQCRFDDTDVLMANLAAYEFWRLKWVGTARIRSLAALAAGGGRDLEAEILAATAAGAWDGVDDAQRDWCSLHGLAPLALTAVREVVERIIQVHLCHCEVGFWLSTLYCQCFQIRPTFV